MTPQTLHHQKRRLPVTGVPSGSDRARIPNLRAIEDMTPRPASQPAHPSPIEEVPVLGSTPIICFGKDWGTDPTSNMHVMRILARTNRVLWVNSIGTRRPGVNRRDLGRLFHKLRRGFDGCVPVAPNMHVFNPLAVPFPEIPVVARFNTALLAPVLRRISRRLRLG